MPSPLPKMKEGIQMTKVYIDGSVGTTGLGITQRLQRRSDITLLSIDPERRKETRARAEMLNAADVAILCLPDDAAREAVALIDNPNTAVLDASTAHRTAEGWVYGLPEIERKAAAAIAHSKRVANPGCHASGFVALVRPLVEAGLLDVDQQLFCHSLTGYSGGGKGMIADYAAPNPAYPLKSPRIYALGQSHKHLPEMKKYSGMGTQPHFSPIVADFYAGMAVSLPLHSETLKKTATPDDLRHVYAEFYDNCPMIMARMESENRFCPDGFVAANAMAGYDGMVILVCGSPERMTAMALFDNLGKGASGAAVQNLNLMMGVGQDSGLVPFPSM